MLVPLDVQQPHNLAAFQGESGSVEILRAQRRLCSGMITKESDGFPNDSERGTYGLKKGGYL